MIRLVFHGLFGVLILPLILVIPGCVDSARSTPTTFDASVPVSPVSGAESPAVTQPAEGLGVQPSSGNSAQKSPRIALVIGNKDYVGSPLKNPVNDASDIRDALQSVGFEVIYRANADISAMNEAVREFRARIQEGGVAMVYYSGHGAQANGINYLIPVGADIQSTGELKARGYDADIIVAEMADAGSAVNILVLDACRNNPFLSVRSTSGGLATMTASKGTIIAFATSPGAVAEDNGRGRNGLYTSYLKTYMTRKGMKIEDVFKKVREEVLKTNPKQIPWESSSLIGDFCLAGCGDESKPWAQAAVSNPETPGGAGVTRVPGDAQEANLPEFALTAQDLQRGRCIPSDEGGYRCIERSRWQTLGRPNLNYSSELKGEAAIKVFCASLPGEDVQDNRCMSREDAVNEIKRCVPNAEGYLCRSVEYWLKSVLDSSLSGSMATQSYTNEPLEQPERFDCTPINGSDLNCRRKPAG